VVDRVKSYIIVEFYSLELQYSEELLVVDKEQ